MSYGFQIIGAHGSIQVDDTYQNTQCVASGSCSNVNNVITYPDQGGYAPQVFIRPWTDDSFVGGFAMFSNTQAQLWTNKVSHEGGGGTVISRPWVGFDWVVFGVNGRTAIDGSTYGMQVFRSDGVLTFDSRYEAPRLQTVCYVSQTPGVQSYPQAYNFSGWGQRPWISANPLFRSWGSDDVSGHDNGMFVRTNGTSQLAFQMFDVMTDGSFVITGDGSSGNEYGFPGYNADIAVIRRYID